MINQLIFPEDTLFKPAQRGRILDVWATVPVGLKYLSEGLDYPNLIVRPAYNIGRSGRDARGISVRPVVDGKYEFAVGGNLVLPYQKINPKVKCGEIWVKEDKFFIEQEKSRMKYALTTRVAPQGCGEMTHTMILDFAPENLVNAVLGRLWASEDVLKKEDEIRLWNLEHPSIFGFF